MRAFEVLQDIPLLSINLGTIWMSGGLLALASLALMKEVLLSRQWAPEMV
jgi:hypothetical protein